MVLHFAYIGHVAEGRFTGTSGPVHFTSGIAAVAQSWSTRICAPKTLESFSKTESDVCTENESRAGPHDNEPEGTKTFPSLVADDKNPFALALSPADGDGATHFVER